MRSRTLIVSLLAVAAVGCHGPVEHLHSAAPVKLEPGWSIAESREDGVSVAVPPNWKEGVYHRFTLGNALGGGGGLSTAPEMPNLPTAPSTNDPQGAALEKVMGDVISSMNQEQQEQFRQAKEENRKKGILLEYVDGSQRAVIGEAPTHFVVKRIAHGGGVSLADAAYEEKMHLMAHDTGKSVKLPIGPASKIEFDLTRKDGAKEFYISYVMVDGDNAYVLRFTATDNPAPIQAVADTVAQSLRITPSKS